MNRLDRAAAAGLRVDHPVVKVVEAGEPREIPSYKMEQFLAQTATGQHLRNLLVEWMPKPDVLKALQQAASAFQASQELQQEGWVVEGFSIGIPSGYHYRITRTDDPVTFKKLPADAALAPAQERASQETHETTQGKG